MATDPSGDSLQKSHDYFYLASNPFFVASLTFILHVRFALQARFDICLSEIKLRRRRIYHWSSEQLPSPSTLYRADHQESRVDTRAMEWRRSQLN